MSAANARRGGVAKRWYEALLFELAPPHPAALPDDAARRRVASTLPLQGRVKMRSPFLLQLPPLIRGHIALIPGSCADTVPRA
jgi:hypothetical protein